METGKDVGEILYGHTLHNSDHPLLNDPTVLSYFMRDFNIFYERVLPVWRERHEMNEENDPKLSSSIYIFMGDGVYAIDHLDGKHPDFFPYKEISEVVSEIEGSLKNPRLNSIIFSTLCECLRLPFIMEIESRGLVFDDYVVYRPEEECLEKDL